MSSEGENVKISHQIVTRPFDMKRYLDSDSVPLGSKSLTEINIKRADILDKIRDFSVDKKMTPTSLMKEIMDCYSERFGKSIKKPDVFIHLIQEKNLEPLAPRLQIYVSDIVLGNLNRDGFYRTIVEGNNPDLKKTKKYLSEVLRFYWAGVADIKGVYFGYRVNP